MVVFWVFFEGSFVDGLSTGCEKIRVKENAKVFDLGSWKN